MKNPIELIAPAGDMEKLRTAIHFGATAVYMGGNAFSLRAKAENFDEAGLFEAVKYTHAHGAKAYVAVNVFARNEDFAELPAYIAYIKEIGADAVIVSDPGVFALAKEAGLNIHISTQANVTNDHAARFWRDLGAKRVIVARELSLREIKEMRSFAPDLEIEAFCHGAMCVAYSGRCLLSDYMTGRSGNKGECAQPCRYEYSLEERKRPGELFTIADTENGAYILSPKDLRMVEYLPDMVEAGITSLKIEGRMKTPFYVACTVKAYRAAIDDMPAFTDKILKNRNTDSTYRANLEKYINILNIPSNRGFHSGFYFGKPGGNSYRHESGGYIRDYEFAGYVDDMLKGGTPDERSVDIIAKVRVKGKIEIGDSVVWVTASGDNTAQTITTIYNSEMTPIDKTTVAGSIVYIPAPHSVRPMDVLARRLVRTSD